MLGTLDELDDKSKAYDQFRDKKSTYNESIYTTILDESKIDEKTKRFAQ